MKNEKRQFVVLATIGCRFLVNVLSPKLGSADIPGW